MTSEHCRNKSLSHPKDLSLRVFTIDTGYLLCMFCSSNLPSTRIVEIVLITPSQREYYTNLHFVVPLAKTTLFVDIKIIHINMCPSL